MRELQLFLAAGRRTVSSSEIAQALGVKSAAVRKDLASAGTTRPSSARVGRAGVGYDCRLLSTSIRELIGTNRRWRTVLVGAGNIGNALLGYSGFEGQGFEIIAVFDVQKGLVGRTVGRQRVRAMRDLRRTIQASGVTIGIVAVPRTAAQGVATQLVDAGVLGILNFAPMRLAVDESVAVVNIDVSVSLEQLAIDISARRSGGTPRKGGRQ